MGRKEEEKIISKLTLAVERNGLEKKKIFLN